jgi:hypothetical protein
MEESLNGRLPISLITLKKSDLDSVKEQGEFPRDRCAKKTLFAELGAHSGVGCKTQLMIRTFKRRTKRVF